MAFLLVLAGKDEPVVHDLEAIPITIGRAEDNRIVIPHLSVSSHHAQIVFSDGAYHLRDLDSANGIKVNGQPVSEALLRDGDLLRFAVVECVFQAGPQPSSQRAAAVQRHGAKKASATFPIPLSAGTVYKCWRFTATQAGRGAFDLFLRIHGEVAAGCCILHDSRIAYLIEEGVWNKNVFHGFIVRNKDGKCLKFKVSGKQSGGAMELEIHQPGGNISRHRGKIVG